MGQGEFRALEYGRNGVLARRRFLLGAASSALVLADEVIE